MLEKNRKSVGLHGFSDLQDKPSSPVVFSFDLLLYDAVPPEELSILPKETLFPEAGRAGCLRETPV